MKSFIDNFTRYENYAPAGVLLPKIEIEKKFYNKLKIKEDEIGLTQKEIWEKKYNG